MKRFLCILLCLLLAAPAALADYTPTELFRTQFITGGNGLRGTASITVAGVADWLDLLLPFAGTKLQVRIIGEKQGAMSALVTDDEDWQMKLWAKDAAGEQQALTCLYGSPEGILLQSALLPDTLLMLPVKGVNLPYQLAQGDMLQLLTSFDLLGLNAADNGGNTPAWSAMSELGGIDAAIWEADWAPVLAKYDTLMDMWLSAYATPAVVSGAMGSMTLRTSYDIPAADVKAQTKYILGLMLVDGELQALMTPLMTDEQRSLYFNPAMLWFYEHCIDIAPLNGSILLEREMTARGETRAMTISLPLPTLPAELTDSLGKLAAQIFSLPYTNAFEGVDRISLRQEDGTLSVSLTSAARTITLIVDAQEGTEDGLRCEGFFRIIPAVGVEEPPLSAAFGWTSSERMYEDDDYNTHEDFAWSLEIMPDESIVSSEDPFASTYVEFAPVAFSASAGFMKKDKAASPVQLELTISAVLPDAEITVEASLKVAERWEHDPVPAGAAEDVTKLTDDRRDALRTIFLTNAVNTMTDLTAAPAAQ